MIQFEWKVCGKSHKITHSISSSRYDHRQLSWWPWQHQQKHASGQKGVVDIDPSGFSCGLWMLFHLLTGKNGFVNNKIIIKHLELIKFDFGLCCYLVHAEKILLTSRRFDKTHSLTGVQDIIIMIQSFVNDLFRCYSCREHFLRAMDACYFDGCHITGTNYTGLQVA